MYEEELINNNIQPNNKLLLNGYENYFYEYDDLSNKIQSHKSSRNKMHRYEKNCNLECHTIITDTLRTRIFNLFNMWFKSHPNPSKGKLKLLQELLQNAPTIFILQYNNIDIGCIICALNDNYCLGEMGFDLCRCGYQNATLFLDFFICKYIKENFNIDRYYIGGYVDGNTTLKKYKEKWATGKLKTYGLNKDYFNNIINILISRLI